MEELIFYTDKIMVMGNSKNLCVFNFAILLKLRKFYAPKIYMLYIKQHHCKKTHYNHLSAISQTNNSLFPSQ